MSIKERTAVAAAIFSGDRKMVVGILRADDPEDTLADMWGLPAVTQRKGESYQEAVARIGWQKLGTGITPVRLMGQKTGHRPSGLTLTMRVYECEGKEPSFSDRDMRDRGVVQYVEWAWVDASVFMPTARSGSLCTQIFLESEGILYER